MVGSFLERSVSLEYCNLHAVHVVKCALDGRPFFVMLYRQECMMGESRSLRVVIDGVDVNIANRNSSNVFILWLSPDFPFREL